MLKQKLCNQEQRKKKKKDHNAARKSEESVTKPFSGWSRWQDGVGCVL